MSHATFPSGLERPAGDDVVVGGEDNLAEVAGGVCLPRLARLLKARGAVLPLARPLPRLSVQQACARLPFFTDAFVASAQLVTPAGARCGTPHAPRSATGPDLLGALCSSPPLARAERIRLRVLSGRLARVQARACSTSAAAAAAVAALLDEGRAFCVSAAREGPELFRVLALGAPAAFEGETEPAAAFAHRARLPVRSGYALLPGDERAMARALLGGARVVAAPFMGRAGVLGAAAPARRPGGEGAAQAFADALAGRSRHG